MTMTNTTRVRTQRSENHKHVESKPLSYIGLGTLAPDSHRMVDGNERWDYVRRGEVIYTLTKLDRGYSLEEWHRGEVTHTTVGPNREAAIGMHFGQFLPHSNPMFKDLLGEMLKGDRDVNVAFATRPEYIFIPAGYIFSLRVPVAKQNHSVLEKLRSRVVSGQANFDLADLKTHPAVLLRLTDHGEVCVNDDVALVEWGVVLKDVVEAVDVIWASGVISPGRDHRLHVLDSSIVSGQAVRAWLGDPERGYLTYAQVALDEVDMPLEKLVERFGEASAQLLEGVHRVAHG